ncbi:MAG: hypothetical protein JXR76_32515 [Deltaproteobacteria bacterium]|nr:hypothetical protein [Deltaproteobacteria bacterium]
MPDLTHGEDFWLFLLQENKQPGWGDYLYDNGAKTARLKRLDAIENGRVFRPEKPKSDVRFSESDFF